MRCGVPKLSTSAFAVMIKDIPEARYKIQIVITGECGEVFWDARRLQCWINKWSWLCLCKQTRYISPAKGCGWLMDMGMLAVRGMAVETRVWRMRLNGKLFSVKHDRCSESCKTSLSIISISLALNGWQSINKKIYRENCGAVNWL